jgi:hypothetical protein
MNKQKEAPRLPAIEELRIATMDEASRLSSMSPRTLRRNYGHLIIRIGKRRQGMRVRDALLLSQSTQSAA